MNNLVKTLTVVFALSLGACSSTEDDKVKVPLDNDPRIGETVSQVCFTRNIDSWKSVDNDRNALVVEMNNRQQYKLKLSGGCDPDLAMMRVAVITRSASSCFSRGDKIKTDGDLASGYGSACTIIAINQWNPSALDDQEESSQEVSEVDNEK